MQGRTPNLEKLVHMSALPFCDLYEFEWIYSHCFDLFIQKLHEASKQLEINEIVNQAAGNL